MLLLLFVPPYFRRFVVLTLGSTIASLLERSKKALLDGFRQLGIHRYTTSVEGLPHGWNYVGVWLIYRSKQKDPSGIHQYIPVVVLIEGENGNVLATAPGMDGWMPYAEVLLTIGQGKINGYSRPYQVLPFIQQRLEHDILPQGDTLLLCHAQNLRRAWMWLANGRLSIDSLSFGTESPLPITEWPGLRIVRVRSSQQDETPEWYAVKPDDFGFSKGLFQMGERVFASTYGKPMQFKNTSKGSSILERPTDAAWNPGLYELVVSAVQPGDDPADVAAVAHALRNGSIQYDDATALPLPLHLAKLMEEYILVVNAENEEVE